MTSKLPVDTSASAGALFASAGKNGLKLSNLFNVDGWVVVVTGGGTGLGLTTANALADNGAKVYITGRRLEPLQAAARDADKAAGTGAIIPVQADASTKEGVAKMRDIIAKEEKWVNALVNNHGVSLPHAWIDDCEQTCEGLGKHMFEEETMDRWVDTYVINTASYYFTSFAFLPLLGAAKSVGGFAEPGNIINLASMSGITKTSQRGQFNYNAGKAATISLSHQLATEFARRNLGVRVNVICPGYFPSGMTIINPEENTGSDSQARDFRSNWGIPFARPGSAVDYAQCIFGLITNKYVTGAELVIDGGWLLESAF